jgi:hypothetical protein
MKSGASQPSLACIEQCFGHATTRELRSNIDR